MTVLDTIKQNYDKIHYTNFFDTDKIVGIYEGRASIAGVSLGATIYSTVAQGANLTAKVFSQMIWSLDGGITWQDGDAQYRVYSGGFLQYYFTSTCYSTTSDIVLVLENNSLSSDAPAQTVDYKIIAFSTT